MAACTSGGRAGAALSASASSHNKAKASWLRTRPGNSCSEARRSSSSAAAGQVSPRARKGSSCSPARNWALACPVSWTHSRWQLPSGSSTSGARLSTRCPAGTLWGGSSSAAPAGRGPAEGTLAVHRPLETRQTHSPSPIRVRGAQGCTSCTCPGAATAFQSNSNIRHLKSIKCYFISQNNLLL